MSGGHFDYEQYKIEDIIDSIEKELGRATKSRPSIIKKEAINIYKIINDKRKDYCSNYNFIHLESARYYFKHKGYKIIDIDNNNFIAEDNDSTQYEIHKFEYEEYEDGNYYPDYSKETLNEFKNAIKILKKAYIYTQRIDWLLSGDDGEDSFHKRLKEELTRLDDENNNSQTSERFET